MLSFPSYDWFEHLSFHLCLFLFCRTIVRLYHIIALSLFMLYFSYVQVLSIFADIVFSCLPDDRAISCVFSLLFYIL